MQRPVRLAEPAFLRDLLDREVPADGQVHDRRGDVEGVRLLVDDRAHLARAEVLRWRELDRGDAALEQRHRLRLAGGVAHRLIDRRADETPVAPTRPEQPATSRDQEQEQAPGQTERGGGSRERTADAPRLHQEWLRFRDDALGQRRDHRERLEREQVRLPEAGRPILEDPRLIARRGRADRPCIAGDVGDGGRCAHGRRRGLDGHLPVRADRVPVELVVVAEAVHRGLHRVHDRVGMRTGDGLVGIADLDPRDAAGLLRDLVVRRRSSGRLHRLHVERVDAVVAVVVRLTRRHVSEDPVVRGRSEVVRDDLGDPDRVVGADLDRHVVRMDHLARLRERRRPPQRRHGERRQHPAEASHRCSTKKNEMAMMKYAPINCAPSSQLLSPSSEISVMSNADSPTAATSNVLKTKSMG